MRNWQSEREDYLAGGNSEPPDRSCVVAAGLVIFALIVSVTAVILAIYQQFNR